MHTSSATRPAPAPRRRRLLALCAIAAAITPLAGCGGDKASGNLDPATLTPASASAYLGVTVRPEGERKENAQRISRALFGTDSPGQAILDLAAKATGQSGVDFERDADPWLGDRAAVALLPATSGGGADIVLIAASRDDDKARGALERSGRLPQEGTFRDAAYRRSGDGRLAGAVFEGALVLGSERAVQGVIASARDDSVLSEAARYTQAIGELPKDGVATAYLDVGAVAELIGGLLGGGTTAQLIEPVLSAQGDAIAASVIAERDGLRIEAVGTGTGSGIAAVQAKGGASDAIRTLPGDSWLALGISDVGATVGTLLDAASSAGGLQAIGLNVLLGQIESSLGLRLREDVLAWMGAGGLFVRGTAKGRVSGALVVKSKDPAATRRAVRKLRDAAGGLPAGAGARPFQAPGIDEGALLSFGKLRLELAAAGERFIIAIGPGALAKALRPGEQLADSPKFQAAQRRLGDDLKAGLYLDLPQLGDVLERSGEGPGGALLAGVLRRMTQLAAGGRQDGDTSRVRLVVGVPAG